MHFKNKMKVSHLGYNIEVHVTENCRSSELSANQYSYMYICMHSSKRETGSVAMLSALNIDIAMVHTMHYDMRMVLLLYTYGMQNCTICV